LQFSDRYIAASLPIFDIGYYGFSKVQFPLAVIGDFLAQNFVLLKKKFRQTENLAPTHCHYAATASNSRKLSVECMT